MSGRKESTFDITQDVAEEIKLLGDIKDQQNKLKRLAARVENLLIQTSEGIKDTFPQDVRDAHEWLLKTRLKDAVKPTTITSITLESLKSSLQEQEMEGSKLLLRLEETFNRIADAMERTITSGLSQMERAYEDTKGLLADWFAPHVLAECEKGIQDAKQSLVERRLNDSDQLITQLEDRINFLKKQAEDMEHKHQKREYVLKSLRKVCVERGFKVLELKYEDLTKGKSSPIICKIDGLSQGILKIYLSMDRIRIDSVIADDKCIDQFDEISEKLKGLGITTKFRREGEKPDPKRIQKGEKEEPSGHDLEHTA